MTDVDDNNLSFNHLEGNRAEDLLKQELDVNVQEQVLVSKRINIIKEYLNELPKTDPEYAILFTQFEMDQIQLDELKIRQESLNLSLRNLSD